MAELQDRVVKRFKAKLSTVADEITEIVKEESAHVFKAHELETALKQYHEN
mgnify:CR=1 FL=1